MKVAKSFFDKIGYSFNNINLLEEALSHTSLRQHRNKYRYDYEKLEFFGDSILYFVITEKLYSDYSESFSEGRLAKFRNYLVSKEVIVKVAQFISLEKHIIMTQGEEKLGGRYNTNNIENAMEALLAAIYLDSNYNINVVREIILKLWDKFYDLYKESDFDPKSCLQEYLQKLGYNLPSYDITTEFKGKDKLFLCNLSIDSGQSSIGRGLSIKEAKKDAARVLGKKLGIIS